MVVDCRLIWFFLTLGTLSPLRKESFSNLWTFQLVCGRFSSCVDPESGILVAGERRLRIPNIKLKFRWYIRMEFVDFGKLAVLQKDKCLSCSPRDIMATKAQIARFLWKSRCCVIFCAIELSPSRRVAFNAHSGDRFRLVGKKTLCAMDVR